MRRREILAGALAFLPMQLVPGVLAAAQLTPEEIKRRIAEAKAREAEWEAKAVADFPFERVETHGDRALATWEQLKAAGRGSPVVLGDDKSVAATIRALQTNLHPMRPNKRTVAEILSAADGIEHPKDLINNRQQEQVRARKYLDELLERDPNARLPQMIVTDANGNRRTLTREEVLAAMKQEPKPPLIGEWPADVPLSTGPSVAFEVTASKPLDKVHIALIPTDDWTTIPAHLQWGGWNACPHPEFHVAALRSWRDRFGAELVGMRRDTMDLRVARRPQTREAALELAREQYVYCNDIVDQGPGTLSALAASLLTDPWWFFWWD
jgi:Domain of unknown function (DUF4253)